ncbi:hypothetical protein EK904_008178 [Melospiza melodia maxima]|nr:hypothetical protein EK904_008178 [Melospiza melodia maxima]
MSKVITPLKYHRGIHIFASCEMALGTMRTGAYSPHKDKGPPLWLTLHNYSTAEAPRSPQSPIPYHLPVTQTSWKRLRHQRRTGREESFLTSSSLCR